MKTRLCKFLLMSFIAVSGFSFTGCGDDITEIYEVGANIESHWFDVSYEQWKWNVAAYRYEHTRTFNAFDDYMYDVGAVDGSVYIWKTINGTDYKVLTKCPSVLSYNETGIPYTETIGFDAYLEPTKKLVFYIQRSDLSNDVYLDDYSFKIVFTYQQ